MYIKFFSIGLLIFLITVSESSASFRWAQLGSDINGELQDHRSGSSVSLSAGGSRIAIGACYNDNNGTDSGHVRIFEYVAGEWTQLGSGINGEAVGDKSGWSVSLSADGNLVAIGAPYNDDNKWSGYNFGHARIFEYVAGEWTQLGSDINGETAGDLCGKSVSLNAEGTRIAVGADFNDDNGTDSGRVRIFEYVAGEWTQLGSGINGEAGNNYSGRSVSLNADGNRVAIGAIGNEFFSGHVRIFEYIAGEWTQLGLDINGVVAFDESGNSVSLNADGDRVAIGAPHSGGNGDDSGQVRIFEYIEETWMQVGLNIDGDSADNYSGHSVSLSADGNRVAIGAFKNKGNNGINSGHVRIFEYVAGEWTRFGVDIDGEAPGDYSGFSVSLSADGNRVAIGALYHAYPVDTGWCFWHNLTHVELSSNPDGVPASLS